MLLGGGVGKRVTVVSIAVVVENQNGRCHNIYFNKLEIISKIMNHQLVATTLPCFHSLVKKVSMLGGKVNVNFV